jgi:hypothetical protein
MQEVPEAKRSEGRSLTRMMLEVPRLVSSNNERAA